jgi:hypothetical protein
MNGRKAVESIGEVYGRLTVLGIVGRDARGKAIVTARCSCDGNVKEYGLSGLRFGSTASCGCLSREALVQRSTTHGLGAVGLQTNYSHMMDRCFNPDNSHFEDYGGKGITVEPWLQDPLNYKTYVLYVLGPKPSREWTMDRIDHRGNYARNNIRWATKAMQTRNREPSSLTRYLTFRGRTLSCANWGRELEIPLKILVQRIDRNGWSVEKALTTPVQHINQA